NPALELRSGNYTLPTLRLFDGDVELIHQQLKEKIDQSPSFFINSPVVLDLQELKQDDLELDALVNVITELKMCVSGVRGGSPKLHALASKCGLAVLAIGATRASEQSIITPQVEAKKSDKTQGVAITPDETDVIMFTSETITAPVRSGQRRYTRHGDLIALAQISEGAELMADGNIHIYGTLRGRALAGVQGDTSARIYCQNLQAELVAIAGHYQVSEDIDDALFKQPVQIYLTDQKLVIEKL
ncbi:MAG TPA: septum site-determining protein MinC, partial [Crenotrichaceae bacterium]|nr:septum site-determining protein MinC [Crenotrichaceae bacterium]